MNERHNVELASDPKRTAGSIGRNVIAVIGIDRYHHWRRLANAVRDATGALDLFRQLGFEQVTEPLLDDGATGKAINALVTDDLMKLGSDDSLVLFYAGHGGTRAHCLGDQVIKTGYLIPVDAADSPNEVSTWINLEGWLRAIALLPAKHILVVLDACHSGIALDPVIKWRDIGSQQDVPLSTLQARRSRRIITSALDDQIALDSGPVHGHSLFTGCLIEALTHGIRRDGTQMITGSQLGVYVQQRVGTYPGSRQTPDFGTFAFDDRGEMVISEQLALSASGPLERSPLTPTLSANPVADAPKGRTSPSGMEGEVGRRPVASTKKYRYAIAAAATLAIAGSAIGMVVARHHDAGPAGAPPADAVLRADAPVAHAVAIDAAPPDAAVDAAPIDAASQTDLERRLELLKELYDEKKIDQQEYDTRRKKLLEEL